MEEGEKHHKSKKPFIVKRLWRKLREVNWKDPLNKWKLLFISIITFIFIVFFTYGVVAGTSTNTFCASCHEMSPEYTTHVFTAHSEQKCVSCHIETGIANTVTAKVMAMKELYHHVTKTVPDPIYPTMVVRDTTCLSCHSQNRNVTPSNDLIVNHSGHIDVGIPCITCHAGVAHAKVVERGISTHDTYDLWNEENADKLISRNYISPNMGTCIDCHQQVNEGGEPWQDDDYLLSVPANRIDPSEVIPSNQVFENIFGQGESVQLSMECATCHLEVTTPENHNVTNWENKHGSAALEQLNQCLNCHDEDKWLRSVQPQSMEELLYSSGGPNLEFYVPDMNVVQSESRNATFCYTCHTERPAGHGSSNDWLRGHAEYALTKQQQEGCFVCHDNQKETILTAPTDVYCEACHRTGLQP